MKLPDIIITSTPFLHTLGCDFTASSYPRRQYSRIPSRFPDTGGGFVAAAVSQQASAPPQLLYEGDRRVIRRSLSFRRPFSFYCWRFSKEGGCSTEMNSKRGGGKASLAAATSSSPKGKSISPQHGHSSGGSGFANNSPKIDQPSQDMADLSMDSSQDGEWEVYGKKSRNQTGNGAAKPRGPSNAPPKAWGHQEMSQKNIVPGNGGTRKVLGNNWQTDAVDSKRQVGRGNTQPQSSSRGWEAAYTASQQPTIPPLRNGWQWSARAGSSNPSQTKTSEDVQTKSDIVSKLLPHGVEDTGSELGNPHADDASDDEQLVDSDEYYMTDDSDSDVSQKSYETRKKNRWFKKFFEELDRLTFEQLNEPLRQWHCPACHDGPGAIDWYRGLQPLLTHAKTKGSKRVKLHRELAELLDEEFQRRGTSVIPSGEIVFSKWKGLHETATDREIVWPPMVVVMNTIFEKDENDKWIGMENQELLDCFSKYDALEEQHSYGPHGHRGMSVLIFEDSAIGYLEAERLHKHFAEQGTDREAWGRRRVLFCPGGTRQLYGYMASREDMEIFNQHSKGKSKLKFEMQSYQEMVVGPMKQMSEDNQQLMWYRNRVAKQQLHKKELEETMGVMSMQLRIASADNRIVRERTKSQHQENKEEMDYMEQFFKDQVAVIHETLEAKESAFEKLLQGERDKAKLSNNDSRSKEEKKLRREEIARFIDGQTKGIEEFEAEREKLIKSHEHKTTELKQKHLEEEVELEKEFGSILTQLMEKYTTHPSKPIVGC